MVVLLSSGGAFVSPVGVLLIAPVLAFLGLMIVSVAVLGEYYWIVGVLTLSAALPIMLTSEAQSWFYSLATAPGIPILVSSTIVGLALAAYAVLGCRMNALKL